MRKMMLVPDSDGYSQADGEEVIFTGLDGGIGRYRRDKIGASKSVNVQWTLNPVQYQYWRAFYLTVTAQGSLKFLCDLLSDDGCGPVEHECNFVPGSVNLPSQQGLTYIQQATIEAKPIVHDVPTDESIVVIFENFGMGGAAALLSLEKLANVTMPDNLYAL